MRSILLGAIVLLAASVASAAPKSGEVVASSGFCEASGAVTVPAGAFDGPVIVLDNESNEIRAFAPDGSARLVADLTAALGLETPPGEEDDDYAADLEGATWFDGRVLMVGSLGRSKKGNWRPARHWLVAMDATTGPEGVTLSEPTARFDGLLAALRPLPGFEAAIGPADEKRENLAPKKEGINLEGLTVAADGQSLLLGFRNPLADGKSLVVKFLNPGEVLFDDPAAAPRLELLDPVDLGGRGIRSMEYAEGAGAYFIVAGPVGGDGGFDLYRWTEGGTAEPVPGVAAILAALPGFAPEGMIVDPSGTKLRLFSDDEEICDDDAPGFRSIVLTLE